MSRTETSHPELEALERFFRAEPNDKGSTEASDVEAHLRRCSGCAETARQLIPLVHLDTRQALKLAIQGEPGGEMRIDSFSIVAERVARHRLLIDLETQNAKGLLAELMLRPPAARREAVRTASRYQRLGLCRLLLDQAWEEGFRDVARAVELAEIAVEVADCLSSAFYTQAIVGDARTRAWSGLGNARRVARDLFGAERALLQAGSLLESGSGDPAEAVNHLSLLASLRSDQARYAEAGSLLAKAIEICESISDTAQLAKLLLKQANTERHDSRPEAALEILGRCIESIDRETSPQLWMQAQHAKANFLNEAGRSAEARGVLEENAGTFAEFPNFHTQVGVRWMEAKIAANLGEYDIAIAAYRDVREAYIEREMAYDVVESTLDLASVHLNYGELGRVRELAGELIPLLRSQDVHAHATAALLLFQQAAEAESLSSGVLASVRSYLSRARNNPYLPFEPPTID